MISTELRIDVHHFGKELAGAMNDVGFGDSEDAEWFVDELFFRLKRHYQGYKEVLGQAQDATDALLDINRGLEPTAKKEMVE